jgi:hypothetical protein
VIKDLVLDHPKYIMAKTKIYLNYFITGSTQNSLISLTSDLGIPNSMKMLYVLIILLEP